MKAVVSKRTIERSRDSTKTRQILVVHEHYDTPFGVDTAGVPACESGVGSDKGPKFLFFAGGPESGAAEASLDDISLRFLRPLPLPLGVAFPDIEPEIAGPLNLGNTKLGGPLVISTG